MQHLQSGDINADDPGKFLGPSSVECMTCLFQNDAEVVLDLLSVDLYSKFLSQSCLQGQLSSLKQFPVFRPVDVGLLLSHDEMHG